jgi:hypothetical protein
MEGIHSSVYLCVRVRFVSDLKIYFYFYVSASDRDDFENVYIEGTRGGRRRAFVPPCHWFSILLCVVWERPVGDTL